MNQELDLEQVERLLEVPSGTQPDLNGTDGTEDNEMRKSSDSYDPASGPGDSSKYGDTDENRDEDEPALEQDRGRQEASPERRRGRDASRSVSPRGSRRSRHRRYSYGSRSRSHSTGHRGDQRRGDTARDLSTPRRDSYSRRGMTGGGRRDYHDRDNYHQRREYDSSSRRRNRSRDRYREPRRGYSGSRSRSARGGSSRPAAAPAPEESKSTAAHPTTDTRNQTDPDPLTAAELKLRSEEDRKRRELDEARRDDQTVLVMNLNLKSTEREVWKWFSERAGKVRDIQVIRDSRSGKSKGVGYVEFFTQEAVIKALSLTGQLLEGQPIKVQASQAEKNRAAKMAKQQAAEAAEGGPMKIYVGGLVDSLANLSEDELRQLFSPFGDIVNVDVHTDPYTGKCKGFAFVQFYKATDAREAMAAMNGFEIAGRAIRVGFATESVNAGQLGAGLGVAGGIGIPGQAHQLGAAVRQGGGNIASLAQMAAAQAAAALVEETPDSERLDDEGGGLMSGATTRIALMQKLQRHPPPAPGLPGSTALNQVRPGAAVVAPALTYPPAAAIAPPAAPTSITQNVILHNMFTYDEAAGDPNFMDEIVEDVQSECSKFGTVLKVYVNRASIDGRVGIKFMEPSHALEAHKKLHGRLFSGHEVHAEFISDFVWDSLVKAS